MSSVARTLWPHQAKEIEEHWGDDYRALFWEMRTGKTPALIGTAARLWISRNISGWLHLAPNGVHADFVREYLPQYMPRDHGWSGFVWRAGRAHLKSVEQERVELVSASAGALPIVSVNIDAIRTKTFRQFAAKFLARRRCLTSIDESLDISSWSKRTKVAIELGKRSAYRRILDGTPADARPEGLFYQFQFLRKGCLGFTSKQAFLARYAVMQDRCTAQGMRAHEVDPGTGVCPFCHKKAAEFSTVESYRNLDELRAKMAPISSRILRQDVADAMPPKIYERRTFELSKAQRQKYDQLAEEYRVELETGELEAAHVLTRMLRLQQIASNFLPESAALVECPACKPPYGACERCGGYGFVAGPKGKAQAIDPKHDPRLDALSAVVGQLRPSDQVVLWSRFRHDRDAVSAWASSRGERAVRYDGDVDVKTRLAGYDAFRQGNARYFSGDPVAAGRGLDLSRATAVVYFSHGWSLRFRRQSEDRAQSLAKRESTLYLDLCAEGTVDERIIDALRAGKDLAAEVMGDPRGEWI